MLDLNSLTRSELEEMGAAGEQVLNCYRVLAKSGDNIVGEVIKGQGTFYEMDHYPKGDVYDPQTHCQYYYHAHREGEHGHFHTFLRSAGMPDDMRPLKGQSLQDYMEERDDKLTHLVAISMDARGYPISLFTTNRWVTAENWYPAEDVLFALNRFEMDLVPPSWPVNIWITNLVRLYLPVIRQLILDRDKTVKAWAERHPNRDVFEDRELEVTSEVAIDVASFLEEIQRHLEN
ncbi:DUF6969 family protein [Sneathiella glossodoripedis]|uniref:DUF6969 family protein n=1 Tax=Sneathiella glossodoripedis TaxID=418853 RepID=UPI00047286D6|nr:hypothetical protein [Sneathiella glossodoripedis]